MKMKPTTESRVAESREAPPDPATVEKVRSVFGCLSKFILGKKIYTRNNPTLVRFAGEFNSALRAFFEIEDELVVAIEKGRILWEDEVVYENDKRDESIAFLLYKDGIGELSISITVTTEEIDLFVDLIKDEVRSLAQDVDIVTKFWRADFEHISYRVLDEYLVGEFGEGRMGEAGDEVIPFESEDHPDTPSFADKGRVVVEERASLEPLDAYLIGLVGRGAGDMPPKEKEERFQDMMSSIFTVSSDELRLFQEEVYESKKSDNVVGFVSEYLDFTLIKDNSSAVRDVLNVIECLVDYLIMELNGGALAELLSGLREFAGTHHLPDKVAKTFRVVERKLVDPSILVSLGESAGSSPEEAADVFKYFEIVGKKSIPSICKLLEDQADQRFHKHARESLIRIAGPELPDVIDQLNIDKPQIARDVIAMVKRVNPQEIPNVIKEMIHYPDDLVRHEAIMFLSGFASAETLTLLVTLLDDPDKAVRLKTLAAISGVSAPLVRETIEEKAFGKDLCERDADEQLEIFRAYGRAAGADAVGRLRQTTGKRNIFGFGKRQATENRLLAIGALESIETAESRAFLEDLTRDSDESVRERAREVLDRFEAEAPVIEQLQE
jgi:HEAT repeat protein